MAYRNGDYDTIPDWAKEELDEVEEKIRKLDEFIESESKDLKIEITVQDKEEDEL